MTLSKGSFTLLLKRFTVLARHQDSPGVKVFGHWAVAVAFFLLAFSTVAMRNNLTPDILTDEILYTRLGIRVAEEGALTWDTGRVSVIHPPLFFLAEGVYWSLTSDPDPPLYTPGDIFEAVHHARLVNAVFAGLTASLFFWLGLRLHGVGLGAFLAILFLLDPFGLRINRRAMLETMAGLLTIGGLSLLLSEADHVRISAPRAILAGLLMGAAILTKELSFTTPVAVALFAIWELWRYRAKVEKRPETVFSPIVASGIAFLSYLPFPLWAISTGHWERFSRVKFLALQRLVGLVHTSGWNRPGVSILDFVVARLVDYGSSYLLLALGFTATVLLLLLGKNKRSGRLLITWGMLLYPFYGFVAVFGSGNDQFFYLLLLPAITFVGYALYSPFYFDGFSRFEQWIPSRLNLLGTKRLIRDKTSIKRSFIIVLLFLILSFNFSRWWDTQLTGLDNGYKQLREFIHENVPSGEPINATGDALKFRYFFPEYPITEVTTAEEAIKEGVRYYTLAPKDIWFQYGRITESFAAQIAQNGEEKFFTTGDTYGDIYLFFVDIPKNASDSPQTQVDTAISWTIPPATTGFIQPFLWMYAVWFGFWAVLAIWFHFRIPKLGITKKIQSLDWKSPVIRDKD